MLRCRSSQCPRHSRRCASHSHGPSTAFESETTILEQGKQQAVRRRHVLIQKSAYVARCRNSFVIKSAVRQRSGRRRPRWSCQSAQKTFRGKSMSQSCSLCLSKQMFLSLCSRPTLNPSCWCVPARCCSLNAGGGARCLRQLRVHSCGQSSFRFIIPDSVVWSICMRGLLRQTLAFLSSHLEHCCGS